MKNNIYNIAVKESSNLVLNAQEKETLSSYLIDEESKNTYAEILFVLKQTQPDTSKLNIDVDAEWERFNKLKSSNKTRQIKKLSILTSGAAAAVVLFISIMFSTNEQQVVTFATNNEVQQYTLPDNSTVTLNKYSTLTIAKNFNKNSRTTTLEGEGFFNIAKNKKKPFIIELNNNLEVKVLGTSFNLRSFVSDNRTDLHVTEGKVALGYKNKEPELIVKKGNQACYNGNDESFHTKSLHNNHITLWQNGNFKFDNTPLPHLIESFEHYYSKSISYPDKTENLKYSGQFNNPLETEFAEIVGLAFGWKYKITEDQIIFSDKK